MDKPRKNKTYWHRSLSIQCPLCGNGEMWKERVMGEKPNNVEERHLSLMEYDGCQEAWT